MVAAISGLSGRAGALSAASCIATIRSLPVHQQLLLLATAMTVAGAACEAAAASEAADAGEAPPTEPSGCSSNNTGVATAGAFSRSTGIHRKLNPFAAANAPAANADGGGADGAQCAGDAALQVPALAAYAQYKALCKEMMMTPTGLPEVMEFVRRLAEQALLKVAGGGEGGGGGRRGGRGGAVRGAKAGGGVRLGLKVLVRDVQTALKDNAAFRKILGLMR